MPDAIRTAEAYLADAPTLSTYLRDRRDEAAAFAAELRARIGYAGETLEFFADLVARKPQHYGHRFQYAEALAAAGRPAEALRVLEDGQRILRAAGRPRVDYMIAIAEAHLALGDTAAAEAAVAPLRLGTVQPDGSERLRWLRLLASLGETSRANAALAEIPEGDTPAERAEVAFTRGWIMARRARSSAPSGRSAKRSRPIRIIVARERARPAPGPSRTGRRGPGGPGGGRRPGGAARARLPARDHGIALPPRA